MVDLPGLVVDADGHVLEPADTWLKYTWPPCLPRHAGRSSATTPSGSIG
jgi:hypothetical protein